MNDIGQVNTSHLSIGKASKYLGVSIDTLRRWELRGRITPYRSPGGHRYYIREDLDKLFNKKYTRDEYSIKPKQEDYSDVPQQNTETDQSPVVIVPVETKQDFPLTNNDNTEANDITEAVNKVMEAKFDEPIQTSQSAETMVKDMSQSILDPINTGFNQSTNPAPEVVANQNNQQKERLQNILGEKKTDKISRSELFVTVMLMFSIIIDVLLFIKWYASVNFVVPIP